MDFEKIADLVKLIEGSSFVEFSYKEGEAKISMSKVGRAIATNVPTSIPTAVPTTTPEDNEEEELADDSEFILSPIVGTFYSASSPETPAFVNVGDEVKAGQTVCIIEAMKLMNEIECEFDGIIEAILVSNEQKVEYGHPLFKIKRK